MVRGIELELHPPGDYVSDVVRSTGDFFEAVILDAIAERIVGGVLVDAGAMIGNHTAYLAAFVPHTAIHAFEPPTVNLPLLRANTARYPSVTVHPVALSDAAGTVSMTEDPYNHGHDRIGSGLLSVRAVSLDSLGLEDVSLLKIDVEGHEPQVLAGAQATIARWRPLVVIEDWTRAYAALLAGLGYRLAREWERAHQTFMFEATS